MDHPWASHAHVFGSGWPVLGTYCFLLGLCGHSRNGDRITPILTFCYVCHSVTRALIFFLLKSYEQSNVFGSAEVVVPLPSGEGTLDGLFEAVNSLKLRGNSAAPCFFCQERKEEIFKETVLAKFCRVPGCGEGEQGRGRGHGVSTPVSLRGPAPLLWASCPHASPEEGVHSSQIPKERRLGFPPRNSEPSSGGLEGT